MRDTLVKEVACLLVIVVLIAGCKKGADAFFSGRPSEMANLSNRIIAGPPETMVELLRVPSRFPDATESHISHWQGSLIAWWQHPDKHELMGASFKKLSHSEMHTLATWVRVRDKNQVEAQSKTLEEIEEVLKTIAPSL